MDCHGHANKRGCFLYGNAGRPEHGWNPVFARLMAMNSPHFDLDGCNFSSANMTCPRFPFKKKLATGAGGPEGCSITE